MASKPCFVGLSKSLYHFVTVLSTNGNKMSNSIDIGVSGTFKIKVFVFIVINKVLNIVNIFAHRMFIIFEFEKE